MSLWSWDGIRPAIDRAAFVHPDATVIGDVIVGAGVYVGPGAVLRGDFGRIVLETGCNVQETCVVHSFPGKDVVVEAGGHVGHGAVLHGCRVGRNALVGMNTVIMDNAVIGESSIVAAAAFVKAGVEIPPRMLVAGVPAKAIRPLTDEEMRWKSAGTATYQDLTRRSLATMEETVPLTAVETDRKRIHMPDVVPLVELRRREA